MDTLSHSLSNYVIFVASNSQTQAQAQMVSEIAASNVNARPSKYAVVPSVDSATTSTSSSSSPVGGQGTLDTVTPLKNFEAVYRNCFSLVLCMLFGVS